MWSNCLLDFGTYFLVGIMMRCVISCCSTSFLWLVFFLFFFFWGGGCSSSVRVHDSQAYTETDVTTGSTSVIAFDGLDSRSCEPPIFAVYDGPMPSHFDPVMKREVCELIVRLPTKSCMLDPIPNSLLKLCRNDLVLLIAAIHQCLSFHRCSP